MGKVPPLPAPFLRGSSPSTCLPLPPHREPGCQGAHLMRFPLDPRPTLSVVQHENSCIMQCVRVQLFREQVAWAISPPILPSPLPSIARGIRAQYTEALRTGAMMTPSQAPGKSRPSVGTEAMWFPLLLLSTFTYTALGFPLRLSSTRAHPSFRAFGPLPADKEHSGF